MVKDAYNPIDGRTFCVNSEDVNVPGKEYALVLLPVRYSTTSHSYSPIVCKGGNCYSQSPKTSCKSSSTTVQRSSTRIKSSVQPQHLHGERCPYNPIDGRTFCVNSEDVNVPGKEYALVLLPVRYSTKVIGIVDCLVEQFSETGD
ncbi:hypothetical protein CAEBREN_07893 [Caenorhabditis brenneri]|uniref:Uncharacterized protein n=1 Tax=Caenorhabditis brenneri TaxID=135651 RepID=G0PCY7_CAEBE|nr:hypothetical protein CAEBREN_07893 [Caenorhabditis brenneri]